MLIGNEILTIIKRRNFVVNIKILTDNNPNLDLVKVLHVYNSIKFHRFIHMILSGNEILQ